MMKSTIHNEKRHTKPCRFFQKGICPLSADRCDFAHVKMHILPVKYPSDHLKPLQLQDGQCDYRESRQLTAPAKHNEIGLPKAATLHVVPGTESHPVEEVAALTSPQITGEPTNPPAAVTKISPGSRFSPHEPVLLSPVSGRPSGPDVTCTTTVISDDLARLVFRNGDSSPTSDVPSLSDGDSDPPSAPYEVPEFPERWPGSASGLSPVVYCNPSPGFFSPGAPFVHPAYVPWALPKLPARSESRRHGMSARKLKALKTKQCKFYKKNGHCPQGSLCTFIHDPSAIQSPQSDPESPSDGSAGSPTSPSEPRSKYDDEHERNIYPISWRVIGGGVMMGGQREICARYKDGACPDSDDCPYTHPWEEDIKTPIEATLSPTSTPRASYFPQAQTHRAADMSTVQQPVPSVPELIPDLSPIALRGRASPSTVSIRENIPPRPFSTPPRISSRAETDITRGP